MAINLGKLQQIFHSESDLLPIVPASESESIVDRQKKGANHKRSLPTIRAKLALVVLQCAVTTMVGFGLLIGHFYEREHLQLQQDMLLTARAMVNAVDRDLNNGKVAALSLATSPSLASGDLAAFHAQAKALLGNGFPGVSFVLHDRQGNQVVNTIRPFGTPLPVNENAEHVRRVFETGNPAVSDLFIGPALGRPVIAIGVPVWRDGKVAYVLSVSILPERLGYILTEQGLPSDRVVGIFDSEGTVIARTHEPQKFVGQKAVPALLSRLRETNEGAVDLDTLEGIAVHSTFSKSAASGWAVAIGVPRRTLFAEAIRSIAWISWVVVALLVSGFALAWYLGGAISRSVKALASSGAERPRGEQPAFAPMAFREAEEVASELARHRYHLERLVVERTKELEISRADLADSEHFVRAVADNMPGLVAYWDTELRCRFANRKYIEWFNKTPEELIGTHIRELLGDELFSRNEPYLQGAFRGEQQNFERTLTKASGEVRNTWASYIPEFDAKGAVVGIFVLVSDVTELKQAQAEQRIAAAAFESHEAMMITDANSLVLRVNRAFTETTGYTFEEMVGKKPKMLKSGRHDRAFFDMMWDNIQRFGSWKGEIWNRYKDGSVYPNWITITTVRDTEGTITHYVCTLTDITQRKENEEETRHMAFFDVLTGLPNRRLMMDRLKHVLATSSRTGRKGALMFIDLDKFKLINDMFGHVTGDLLLQQVAERLALCVREGDTLARLGGDEFVVIMEDLNENPRIAASQANTVGEKILEKLNLPYDLAGHIQSSTPSIGVTLFSDHKHSIEELLKHADTAMYQAKSEGRNRMCFYNDEGFSSVATH